MTTTDTITTGKATLTTERIKTGESIENGNLTQDQGFQKIISGKDRNRIHTQTGKLPTTTPIGDSHTNTFEKHSDISPKKQKINLTLESFNCYGFSRTADYVLERLCNCDIMGLTETWFRPNELHTIKSAL